MSKFPVHTHETSPESSRFVVAGAKSKYGFVPNLIGMLAESPAALAGYVALGEKFDQSSFSPVERQVVLLSVSYENGCDYCMAAHTVIAWMSGVPTATMDALSAGPQATAFPSGRERAGGRGRTLSLRTPGAPAPQPSPRRGSRRGRFRRDPDSRRRAGLPCARGPSHSRS